MEAKQTVAVIGGAGYIGAHTVNLLLKKGYKVEVVDSFLEGINNIIKNKFATYHNVDIRDKEKLGLVFKKTKPVAVFKFAGLWSVHGSMVKPSEYYDTNIVGGINLLECMREAGITKIVFSSSAAVYGEPQSEEIHEDHQKNPTNTYGHTKLIFENLLKDYHRAYGFSSVSLRYFNAAGCDIDAGLGEHHKEETHVIPSIIETLLGKRQEFFVYGNDFSTPDGTGVRDYIHVSDLASAHIRAMEKMNTEEKICTQYNLGINKGFSVLELIRAAEKVSGKKLHFSYKPRREGDPSSLIANSSKAQKELGWKPEYTEIGDIIDSAYLFFKNKK